MTPQGVPLAIKLEKKEKMKPNRRKTVYLWIILISSLFILSNGCASKEEKRPNIGKEQGNILKRRNLRRR